MLNEDDKKLVGACGINCATCDIYEAYKKGDVDGQRRIIEAIFGEDSDIIPEQITCNGCGGRPEVHWSPECKIMLCAHGRDLLVCSQCPEFTCSDLESFFSKGYEKAEQNALRQREIGLEAWWKEQQMS